MMILLMRMLELCTEGVFIECLLVFFGAIGTVWKGTVLHDMG